MIGRVALVGAGPGDPALLTVRAVELLRVADVVAHDELVSESILALVPARAELVSVGRRAGSGDTGYCIHPLVLDRARAGKVVVRLKTGDPMIFGRGGEEAAELARAHVPFEIVPGVTAALGAASYAGIPLTHRELSSQVVLTTGHRADGGLPPPSDAGRSLALYMAAHDLATNLASLVGAGWSRATPAALVVAATTPDERVISGTIGTLASIVAAELHVTRAPSLVIVGDVVALRVTTDWRSRLPLHGRRVVVAHAPESSAVTSLRSLGADVVELPLVRDGDDSRTARARWPSRVDLVVVPSADSAVALYADAPAHLRAAPAIAIGAAAEIAARTLGVASTRATSDSISALLEAALITLRDGRSAAPMEVSP